MPRARAKRPEYVARLDFEARTIVQMGFAGYFLIVADFINWARRNQVPVGPGRGSGAGSLVAYSLGITDLDPLRYSLLFERFLNPERVSMPDFDIDFCQDGRDRVIDYVKKKYGADSVSQIATFGTLAAKAAVRDVGRVLDLPYPFVDGIAKLIPFQPGKLVTLKRRDGEPEANVIYAREVEPLINEREAAEEEVRQLLELAEQLEGLPRNVGMHAGGVLIAPGKLTDFCPLYVQPSAEAILSQFDKDDVEAVGLVKFDFLGLTTLTILDWTIRYVRMLDPPSSDRPRRAAARRPEARSRSSRPATPTAVFQFESRGMRELLKQAPVNRFEDIIALVALYRPGPMELIPDYVARKSGRERVAYPDARLEPILAPTYGVMVYQEQVMKIAQEIGGYTLGGADLLRKAMGKKLPEEMAKHRTIFVEGATDERRVARQGDAALRPDGEVRGLRLQQVACRRLCARRLPDGVLQGAPPVRVHGGEPVAGDGRHRQGAQSSATTRSRKGSPCCRPTSTRRTIASSPSTRSRSATAWAASRAPARRAIEAVVAARDGGGAFRDLFDFCRRVDKRVVNRRAIEALIRAGAFDAIEPRRAALLASVGIALEAAERAEANAAQVSLFGEEAAEPSVGSSPRATGPMPSACSTRRARSATTCPGIRSPATPRSWRRSCARRIASLAPRQDRVLVAGIVTQMRVQASRRGKMAFVTLDDGHGSAEIMVYNETFDSVRALLREDQLVIAEVKVTQRMTEDGEAQGLRIIAENVFDLATIRSDARQGTASSRATATRRRRRSRRSLRRFARATSRSPCAIATTASAAKSSCPRTGASTSTTR